MTADPRLHDLAAAVLGWLLTYAVHSTILLLAVWFAATRRGVSDGTRDVLWKLGLVGGVLTATAQSTLGRDPLGGRWRISALSPGVTPVGSSRLTLVRRGESTFVNGAPVTSAEAMHKLAADMRFAALGDVRGRLSAAGAGVAFSMRVGGTGILRAPLPWRMSEPVRWQRTLLPPLVSLPDAPMANETFTTKVITPTWQLIVPAMWAGVGLTAIVWLMVGHLRLVRRIRTRSALRGHPLAACVPSLRRRARAVRAIHLSVAQGLPSPIAMLGGEICLPARALVELDAAQQESMVAHEVAHIVRRDPLWLLIARCIEAVLFFQPLNRFARRRMQETAEFLCDAWAVEQTGSPLTLAKCLAAVAEWVGRAPHAVAVSAMVETTGSPLVRRVRRILHGGATMPRGSSQAAGLLGVAALFLLAGAGPRVDASLPRIPGEAMFFANKPLILGVDAGVAAGGTGFRVDVRSPARATDLARVAATERTWRVALDRGGMPPWWEASASPSLTAPPEPPLDRFFVIRRGSAARP
jgi:beta-lactamase regulating signal transducer with metallopeptidase domain